MTNPSIHDLINEKEAAAYLAVSVSWLQKSRQGLTPTTPPYVRIGRTIRYSKSQLEAYIAEKARDAERDTRQRKSSKQDSVADTKKRILEIRNRRFKNMGEKQCN